MKSLLGKHWFTDLTKPKCRHDITLSSCHYCQMLAFITINYSVENTLPFIVDDALRLIYKWLKWLYEEDYNKLLIRFTEQLQRDFIDEKPMIIFTDTMPILTRPLYLNKKKYQSFELNELEKLKIKEKQDKANKKQQIRARRQQNRHRK